MTPDCCGLRECEYSVWHRQCCSASLHLVKVPWWAHWLMKAVARGLLPAIPT